MEMPRRRPQKENPSGANSSFCHFNIKSFVFDSIGKAFSVPCRPLCWVKAYWNNIHPCCLRPGNQVGAAMTLCIWTSSAMILMRSQPIQTSQFPRILRALVKKRGLKTPNSSLNEKGKQPFTFVSNTGLEINEFRHSGKTALQLGSNGKGEGSCLFNCMTWGGGHCQKDLMQIGTDY